MEISEEICRFLPAFVSQSASSFYPHFTWRILSRPIIRLVWVVVYLCTLLKMAAYMSSSLSSEADDSDGKSSAFCYMHTIDTHGRVLLFSEKSFIKFKECAAHWKSWKIVQKVPLALQNKQTALCIPVLRGLTIKQTPELEVACTVRWVWQSRVYTANVVFSV